MKRLAESGINFNKDKCKFRQSSIAFLGHVVDENRVRPHPDKINAVNQMQPKITTELNGFMEMVDYPSKYVPNLTTLMGPLSALLVKNDTSWIWDTATKCI